MTITIVLKINDNIFLPCLRRPFYFLESGTWDSLISFVPLYKPIYGSHDENAPCVEEKILLIEFFYSKDKNYSNACVYIYIVDFVVNMDLKVLSVKLYSESMESRL